MSIDPVRWGMIGCGDVAEVKSGPGFQKASGSALVAVMRRDRGKAEDYARRHGVPRVFGNAEALIGDPDVDAVYIATPVSSHCDLALRVAAAGKPCLVEKPMAMNHAECLRMVDAFAARGVPLWVAYYRRALPRFLKTRELLASGAIGAVTSASLLLTEALPSADTRRNWRFDPAISGGGLLHDLGSHGVDLLDFLLGPLQDVAGRSANTGGAYPAPDVTVFTCRFAGGALGCGMWNFNASDRRDAIAFMGTSGTLATAVFADADISITRDGATETIPVRNPPHVHQPLIQSIVDELGGRGACPSTGVSGARASRVLDELNR